RRFERKSWPWMEIELFFRKPKQKRGLLSPHRGAVVVEWIGGISMHDRARRGLAAKEICTTPLGLTVLVDRFPWVGVPTQGFGVQLLRSCHGICGPWNQKTRLSSPCVPRRGTTPKPWVAKRTLGTRRPKRVEPRRGSTTGCTSIW